MSDSEIELGVKVKPIPQVTLSAKYVRKLRRSRRRREKEIGLMSLPPGIRDAERRR